MEMCTFLCQSLTGAWTAMCSAFITPFFATLPILQNILLCYTSRHNHRALDILSTAYPCIIHRVPTIFHRPQISITRTHGLAALGARQDIFRKKTRVCVPRSSPKAMKPSTNKISDSSSSSPSSFQTRMVHIKTPRTTCCQILPPSNADIPHATQKQM